MDPPADLWLPLQADPASENHIGRVRVAARPASLSNWPSV
jgi:hypothetical protein